MENKEGNTDYTPTPFEGLNPLLKEEGKVPIYRGCFNKNGCFCSGRCKEIIGWEDERPKSILDAFIKKGTQKRNTTMEEAFYKYLETKMPQLFNRGVCSFKIGDKYPTRAVELYETFTQGYQAANND